MFFWIRPLRRPASQVFQACVCQSNVYSLSPRLNVQVLFYNNKFFMNGTNSTIKNPVTPGSSLLQQKNIELQTVSEQNLSSSSENQPNEPPKEAQPLSNKDKLKRAVKDYGATVIIFHVTISLMSLGVSYLVISSGVDVASLLDRVGLSSQSNLATGASTFVVAYAVHKVFAPVRISITLGATPFIVRYLRRVGILKPPKT